jgi:hypothetical protein
MNFFAVLIKWGKGKAIPILLFLSLCIMASCSGKPVDEKSELSTSLEATPTYRQLPPTWTAIPKNSISTGTPLPKATKTVSFAYLSPTSTVTETELPTIENEHFVISQPLSQLMLNWNDVFGIDDGSAGYRDVYYEFIRNHHSTVVDASSELSLSCLIECTKQVWATEKEEVDGFGGGKMIVGRRLTIFMFRSSDSQRAKKTAENFYKGIPNVDDLKDDGYLDFVNAPARNTYFGMASIDGRLSTIISTSIGPIAFGVISWIDGDDGMTEGEIASYFLNRQIMKLEDAGVFIRH